MASRNVFRVFKASISAFVGILLLPQCICRSLTHSLILLGDDAQKLWKESEIHRSTHLDRTKSKAMNRASAAVSNEEKKPESFGQESWLDDANCILDYMPGLYLAPPVQQSPAHDDTEELMTENFINVDECTTQSGHSQDSDFLLERATSSKLGSESDKIDTNKEPNSTTPKDKKKIGFLKHFFSPQGWCMENACDDPKWLNKTCNMTSDEVQKLPKPIQDECSWCFPRRKDAELKAHCKIIGDSMEKALYAVLGALGGMTMVSLVLIFLSQ